MVVVPSEEAVELALQGWLADEDLDIFRYPLPAKANILSSLHRDVADLGKVNRSSPYVGYDFGTAEAHEHPAQGGDPLLIGFLDFRQDLAGLEPPASDGEFKLRIEQRFVVPAVEDIEHRLGD